MQKLTGALLAVMLHVGPGIGLAHAQDASTLPEACGGLDRPMVELDLERYRRILSSPEHDSFREAIDVERFGSDATVEVVDEPATCSRTIRGWPSAATAARPWSCASTT